MPGGSLGFSVVVFCICAVTCIIFLLIRRYLWVGGELGGTPTGRTFSATFLCSLWLLYVVMSILQTADVFGVPSTTEANYGIGPQDWTKIHPKCNPAYKGKK